MLKKIVPVFFLALLLYANVQAQSQIALNRVGVRIGLVNVEANIGTTTGYGLNADLGIIVPGLFLTGYFDYWTRRYDKSIDTEGNWTLWGIHSIAKYYFSPKTSKFFIYTGGGPGLHWSHWSWEIKEEGGKHLENSKDAGKDLDIAVSLLGGVEYAITPAITTFAELRYNIDGVDFFGFYIGGWFRIPKK